MISIQRLTGRPREFFGLMEESAQLGAESARALRSVVTGPGRSRPDLTAVVEARRKDKEVYQKLDSLLSRVFATPIEREDLAAIGQKLYKLPKTIEKFAERYEIVHDKVGDTDFGIVIGMLERATEIVVRMVHSLAWSPAALSEINAMKARLSQIKAEAGHVLLDAERRLYASGPAPLTAIVTKELYDLLTECLEVCRSIGGTLALAVLKNS
ncbi:MAG: hypothetical protein V4675_17205 [Verrucomicrobiota bacterium]